MSASLIGTGVGAEHELAGGVEEVSRALMACDFPLVVWDFPGGVVRLANRSAEELFGRSLGRLVGVHASELMGAQGVVERTMAMVGARVLNDVHAERWVRTDEAGVVRVRVWTRAIDVSGSRTAVSLVIPSAEVGRLGHDSAAPWRDLAPVAVGLTDSDLRVESVSSEIGEVLRVAPQDFVGASLTELLGTDDLMRFLVGEEAAGTPQHFFVRITRGDGSPADVCVLLAPVVTAQGRATAFALIGEATVASDSRGGRVAELERRLRVIGAEVRAAGVLGELAEILPLTDHSQLGELSSRQWEILSRLVRGDRVATIASELYLSPSTVRNHLAGIFRRFGVHSQAELLAVLRSRQP